MRARTRILQSRIEPFVDGLTPGAAHVDTAAHRRRLGSGRRRWRWFQRMACMARRALGVSYGALKRHVQRAGPQRRGPVSSSSSDVRRGDSADGSDRNRAPRRDDGASAPERA